MQSMQVRFNKDRTSLTHYGLRLRNKYIIIENFIFVCLSEILDAIIRLLLLEDSVDLRVLSTS